MGREELWPELLGSVITSTGAAPCSMHELETANTKITPCTKYSVHEVLFMAETVRVLSQNYHSWSRAAARWVETGRGHAEMMGSCGLRNGTAGAAKQSSARY